MSRELVQRTLQQLHEYNMESHSYYAKPLITLSSFEKNWQTNTNDLSSEEVADLEDARTRI